MSVDVAPRPRRLKTADRISSPISSARPRTDGVMRSEGPPPALTAPFSMARPLRIAISLGFTIAQSRLDLGKTMPAADQPLYTAGGTGATASCSPPSPPELGALALRQPLERRHALRHMVKRLLVTGVDRQLRREFCGIIERADLDHDHRRTRPGRHMRTAFGTKFPRHGPFEVAAGKLLGRTLRVSEAISWYGEEHVGRATRDVLAFAAVALRLHDRLTLGRIAHRPAITSAFQF